MTHSQGSPADSWVAGSPADSWVAEHNLCRWPLSDAAQLTIDVGYIAVAVGGIGQPGAAVAPVGTLALRDEGSPGPVDLFAVPLIAARREILRPSGASKCNDNE